MNSNNCPQLPNCSSMASKNQKARSISLIVLNLLFEHVLDLEPPDVHSRTISRIHLTQGKCSWQVTHHDASLLQLIFCSGWWSTYGFCLNIVTTTTQFLKAFLSKRSFFFVKSHFLWQNISQNNTSKVSTSPKLASIAAPSKKAPNSNVHQKTDHPLK